MNILRAHDYGFVEAIRNELSILPRHWLDCIASVPWILLPDDVSPVWTGLMKEECVATDGRKYSKIGGWYCQVVGHPNWRYAPHIYLKPKSLKRATVHEAAHAIEEAMHVPVSELYEPEKALYPYMARDEGEFFACAVDAFVRPAQNETTWNIDDLRKTGAKIYDYLVEKAQ